MKVCFISYQKTEVKNKNKKEESIIHQNVVSIGF